ncbi:helix-turn-helix transcriptional regulator, partial [Patescibacteria group bacterium]|nr:helix-turn-helix transcriptional regulator [Patescibacteria group bacterium]
MDLNTYLQKQLKSAECKREWEKSEPQYQVTRQLISARLEKEFSQRELAQKAQTTQAVVSRVENMSVNPSLG